MTTGPRARRDPLLWLILAASIGLNTHRIGHHPGAGVGGRGAPWDRLFFDYLITLDHAWYTP